MKDWYVYLLECADRSFYTGITTDIQRRVKEHNHSRRAAAYTRARRPVTLVYCETCVSRAAAGRREYELRKSARKEKQKLAEAWRSAHQHSFDRLFPAVQ